MTVNASNLNNSPFRFAYGAALKNGSIYLAGVALELEDRDVPHTIIWERIDNEWKRYQWKNRTYGLAAYMRDGAGTCAYMGYEGTLKIRSVVHGSSEETLESGDDAPSSLRTVSWIRVVEDQLLVSGMRRMVYCRSLHDTSWLRLDVGMRQERKDVKLAGLYSIDGVNPNHLCAVGIGGEVWDFNGSSWSRADCPTNATLLAIRCVGDKQYVIGGEGGTLWIRDGAAWEEVEHLESAEIFTCIEVWRDRCFVLSESGLVYELVKNHRPFLTPFLVDGVTRVSWITANEQRLAFVGGTKVKSLGDDGWRDDSPPAALVA